MHMEQSPAQGKPLAAAGNQVDITNTAEGFAAALPAHLTHL